VARDAGGSETRIIRTVLYASRSEVRIDYDASMKQLQPKHFLARGRTLDLKGSTVPLSSVSIQDQPRTAKWRSFSDSTGHFQLSLLDIPESTVLYVNVLTPTGYHKDDTLWVQVSKDAPQIVLNSKVPAVASEDSIRLEGAVVNTGLLTCNSVDIPIVDGHFVHTLRLQPGKNVIKLTAVDAIGNECVLQNEVMLDKTPPELLDHALLKKTGAAGDVVDVKVKAKDGSGLRRTAGIELLVGDMVSSGYLVYNATSQTYEGSFKYPKGTLNNEVKVKIKSIVLEDYYGNQSVLNPQ
jgi:hypothetical protein